MQKEDTELTLENYQNCVEEMGQEDADRLFALLKHHEDQRWKDQELEIQTGVPHLCGDPLPPKASKWFKEMDEFIEGKRSDLPENTLEVNLFPDKSDHGDD
jgi:hypothetical protein